MGVSNVPRVVAWWCAGRESKPGPLDLESDTLTTAPPSHPVQYTYTTLSIAIFHWFISGFSVCFTYLGPVCWVSAFRLSNDNKWRWWRQLTGCLYRRACSSSQMVWCKGWRQPGTMLDSSRNPSELSQWLCHNNTFVGSTVVPHL